jgi:hypothetical protein
VLSFRKETLLVRMAGLLGERVSEASVEAALGEVLGADVRGAARPLGLLLKGISAGYDLPEFLEEVDRIGIS